MLSIHTIDALDWLLGNLNESTKINIYHYYILYIALVENLERSWNESEIERNQPSWKMPLCLQSSDGFQMVGIFGSNLMWNESGSDVVLPNV